MLARFFFSSLLCVPAWHGGERKMADRDSARSEKVTRKYRDHTLILETRFETGSGVLLLTDFMPIRERHSDVVRIVQCLSGRVSVEMELCVRFDFGRTVPWTGPREGNAWAAAAGPSVLYLRTQEPPRTQDATAFAHFTAESGRTAILRADTCWGTGSSSAPYQCGQGAGPDGSVLAQMVQDKYVRSTPPRC